MFRFYWYYHISHHTEAVDLTELKIQLWIHLASNTTKLGYYPPVYTPKSETNISFFSHSQDFHVW